MQDIEQRHSSKYLLQIFEECLEIYNIKDKLIRYIFHSYFFRNQILINYSVTMDKARNNILFGQMLTQKYQIEYENEEFQTIYCIAHTLNNVIQDILSLCKYSDIDTDEIQQTINNFSESDDETEFDTQSQIERVYASRDISGT